MHSDFAEWYRSAGIEPDGAILQKRWTAVSEFALDKDTIIELVRLFFGLGQPGESFIAAFRGTLQKEDPAFKVRDNEHELALLSGAAVVQSIDGSERELADFAALALVSAQRAALEV
jgi:GTPase-associated system helical domain